MSGEVALDQLAQFIFHSASAEFSSTIRATNCFVNLNMGEGEGRGQEAANISSENSFYFYPGFCILEKNPVFAGKYYVYLTFSRVIE